MNNLTIPFDSQVQFINARLSHKFNTHRIAHINHNRKNVTRYAVTSINKFISSHIRTHVVCVVLKKGAISFIIEFEIFFFFTRPQQRSPTCNSHLAKSYSRTTCQSCNAANEE